ncbi:sensor histidine kinase, partial [Qipengyuania sp.]|uniref:sensor histidine kinase n=1 Tax=Qipengyuania sp. TaxID=2004515 RepID=UPI003AF986E3
MQANQTEDAGTREVLAATQNRIRAISKVHHKLYTRDDITTIDLDEYLDMLVEELRQSLAEGPAAIEVRLATEPVEVSPDTAVSVGVIVNELVSNAAKYAFADGGSGTIDIALARAGETGYAITVSDDGAGMGQSAKPSGSGLGMKIVDAMTRGLGAELERIPCERGTSQRLTVGAKF